MVIGLVKKVFIFLLVNLHCAIFARSILLNNIYFLFCLVTNIRAFLLGNNSVLDTAQYLK